MSAGTPPLRSTADVVAAWGSGTAPDFTFFWRGTPEPDGRIDSGCLSQWWPSPFRVDGVDYASAEHWMMAGKARLFADRQAEKAVLDAGHPADAQRVGRTIRGYEEQTWRRHRYEIVVAGNLAKFSSHRPLAEFLVGTHPTVLVEASPRDLVWGIGLAADDERASNPMLWRGQNLLGFALMDVRRSLLDR